MSIRYLSGEAKYWSGFKENKRIRFEHFDTGNSFNEFYN